MNARPFDVLVLTATLLISGAASEVAGQGLNYPEARKSRQVDDYHGTRVPDPYRWLEDDRSPETAAWVKAENQLTGEYLGKIPYRAQLKARLERLQNYPRYTPPFRQGKYYFFKKNDGLQTSTWSTFRRA